MHYARHLQYPFRNLFDDGVSGSGIKALLCIYIIALTNPVAAHVIARSAHRAGIKFWQGTVVDHYAEDKGGKN